MSGIPQAICEVGAMLGEGPVWHVASQTLWFVDIKASELLRYTPASGELRRWPAPAQAGWLLPLDDGSWAVGLQTGIHRFDPTTGQFTLALLPEPQHPGNRLNDACADAQGRLWFGSMDDAEVAKTGRLYRLQDGVLADSGLPPVAITNGPAVSPDGRTLYHTDTLGRTIWACALEADGSVHSPRVLAVIAAGEGYPDGPVVDSAGAVWTGLFAGHEVRRYAPDGELLQRVPFPVANITKLAFGGPSLRSVYATTARKGLSAAALAQQPHAGDLFSFRVDVPGLPTPVLPARVLPAAH